MWTVEWHQRQGRTPPGQGNAATEDEAKAAWKRCWESADTPIQSAARAKTPENPSTAYIAGMVSNTPPTRPDPATMTPEELCDRLEEYEFKCPGGEPKNTVEWIEIRRRLGAPSPRWR